MNIIVTGALGHIGSYLIRNIHQHIKGPLNITLMDNMMTQRYPSLFKLPPTNNYQFIDTDIRNIPNIAECEKADVIIHLAAITDAAQSFSKKDAIHNNNCLGTQVIADFCQKQHISLVFPSSTSVYGTQKEVVDETCTEEDLKPQSPYAESKLKEEAYIQECAKNGLQAAILRLGTIFGASEGMRFHTAVNKFTWQAVFGKPITVWKTAYKQKRPYCALSDAVKAMSFVIANKLFNGQIYNVVTSNHTVEDVINTIKLYIDSLQVEFVDETIMNQLSYEVNNKKLKEKGFKFQGCLEKGIQQTIELLQQANTIKRESV